MASTVFTVVSCEKEEDIDQTAAESGATIKEHFIVPTQAEEDARGRPTVLGRMRGNPYATETMRQATEALYGADAAAAVATTDLYVMFSPRDFREWMELEEEEFPMFSFDLRRELIYLGEDYREPGLGEDEISPQYAVFPVGEEIPTKYQYEVLAEIHHPHVDSVALQRAAFALVGEVYPPDEEEGLSNRWGSSCYDDWGKMVPCPPRSEVGDDEPAGPGGGGVSPPGCGCPPETNYRIVAGCVQVEDRNNPAAVIVDVPGLGNREVVPVVGVQVRAWNGFFGVRQDHTDNNGCFRIPGEWSRSFRLRTSNKWRNSRVKLHGWTPGTGSAIRLGLDRDLGSRKVRSDAGFNSTRLIYTNVGDRNSRSQVWYQGSHSLNTVARSWQYSREQGVPTPPEGLRYVISNVNSGAGAAPMLKQSGGNWIAVGIATVLIPNPATTIGAAALQQLIPDVWQNYGERTAAEGVTLGATAQRVPFHELGHAIHYRAVGRDAWNANVEFIVGLAVMRVSNPADVSLLPPYGSGIQPGSGWCATIEAWGEYYGASALQRFYANGARDGVSATDPGLEGMIPSPRGFPSDRWIPDGLPLDLEDAGTSTWEGMLRSNAGPRRADNVAGLTMANYFRAMTAFGPLPISPEAVREVIVRDFLPPGQTPLAIRETFETYGY